MTNDINVKGLLKQYRESLDEKYPDPKPKNAPAEEDVTSPGKKSSMKIPKDAKAPAAAMDKSKTGRGS